MANNSSSVRSGMREDEQPVNLKHIKMFNEHEIEGMAHLMEDLLYTRERLSAIKILRNPGEKTYNFEEMQRRVNSVIHDVCDSKKTILLDAVSNVLLDQGEQYAIEVNIQIPDGITLQEWRDQQPMDDLRKILDVFGPEARWHVRHYPTPRGLETKFLDRLR